VEVGAAQLGEAAAAFTQLGEGVAGAASSRTGKPGTWVATKAVRACSWARASGSDEAGGTGGEGRVAQDLGGGGRELAVGRGFDEQAVVAQLGAALDALASGG
jgi:hypothetical protein